MNKMITCKIVAHTHTQDSLDLDKTSDRRPYQERFNDIFCNTHIRYVNSACICWLFALLFIHALGFITLKGSNLDCMPLPTFQKPLAQSSSCFVSTGLAFLALDLAAAFGKWTFTACISLPNCVQVCLICEQTCAKTDLHSGFVSL